MLISVAIPTYNRANRVGTAMRSALEAFAAMSGDFEIVVTDNASTDGTVEKLQQDFAEEIARGVLHVIRNPRNLGITGNKNVGYSAARGDWVVFLDSDDALLPEAGRHIASVLRAQTEVPIVFFRVQDHLGNFVGTRFDSERMLDLKTYLRHKSFGEALTAVNRRIVQTVPYVESLQGYEGLGCARIIARHGPAVLSCVLARSYDRASEDSSSTMRGFLRKFTLLSRGHMMMVREFGSAMPWWLRLFYLAKSACYWMVGTVYLLVTKRT